jgi:hypothetical protein
MKASMYYGMAKAALEHYTRDIANTLGQAHGIRVNCVRLVFEKKFKCIFFAFLHFQSWPNFHRFSHPIHWRRVGQTGLQI